MSVLGIMAAFAVPPPPPPGSPASDELVTVSREDLDALRNEVRALRESLEQRPVPRASVVSYGDAVHVPVGREVEEAVAFGQDIRVDGTVLRDVTAMGGNVSVGPTGIVRGDVAAFAGRISVEPGGRILGNRLDLGKDTSTGSREPAEVAEVAERPTEGWWSFLYHRVVLMLSLAGAGVLVVGLFPHRIHQIASDVGRRPLWSVVVGGTVTLLSTIFGVLFTLITLGLGLPLSFLGFALLAAAWLFGFVGLCQAIGDQLPFAEKPHGRWLTFLVGMGLVSCVGSLPWVGVLVVFAASMMSVGASIISRFGSSSTR